MSGQSVQEWLEGYRTGVGERDAKRPTLFTEESRCRQPARTPFRGPRACASTATTRPERVSTSPAGGGV